MLLSKQYTRAVKAAFSFATLFAALVLAVIVSTPLITRRVSASSDFVFEVILQSSTEGAAQIYYDIGKGWREKHSARVQIGKSNAPATYCFRLPNGVYRALRFDPVDREGVVTFSKAKILDAHERLVKNIAASQFRAAQQISALHIDDDAVQMITVSNANDPILAVSLDAPLLLKADRRQVLLTWQVGTKAWSSLIKKDLSSRVKL